MKRIFSILAFFLILVCFSRVFADLQKISVQISADQPVQIAGGNMLLSVEVKIPKGAHIYSLDNQNSGQATKIELTLPKGYEILSQKIPEAKSFLLYGEKTNGYENSLKVLYEIQVPKLAKPKAEISAKVSALLCSNICVPQQVIANLSISVPQHGEINLFAAIKALIIPSALAFFGGLLLNLMPCVFPVIGIKALSLAKNSQNKKGAWGAALAYTLGVVLCFLGFGAAILALKTTGVKYGWGFQLQEPFFVALMFLLFLAMGLSFSGIYQIGGNLSNISTNPKEGFWGAFLSGMLAVLVASPCSAPFMGSAIGAALMDNSTWEFAFFVFLFCGLGMALPYVVLAAYPGLLRFLPKSGEWMNTFKQSLAFLLYLSCAWLFWVFCSQTNANASGLLGLSAVVLAAACAIFGKWQAPHFSKIRRISAKTLSLALLVVSIYAAFYAAKKTFAENAQAPAQSQSNAQTLSQKISALQKSGKGVFLDFTAKWCITCQANEKAVLNTRAIEKLFAENNIEKIVIDWTKKDPSITEELAKFGRAGVPLYVLYPKNPNLPLQILPQILSYDIVCNAVDKAEK